MVVFAGNENYIQVDINGLNSNTDYTVTVVASDGGNAIGEKSSKQVLTTCEYSNWFWNM